MIEIKNLKKNFGKTQALKGISCELRPGIYGILGPNGSGKTTFLRHLAGVYPDKSNSVFFNGEPIENHKNYLLHVGYLPQHFGHFPYLSVQESLELLADLKGIKEQEWENLILNCLENVHLTEYKDSKVKALSGGMLRRLGIAQAIMGNPNILLFDEPTTGLDPEERMRFKDFISRQDSNQITLISTHIVDDVEAICDFIIVMDKGEILFIGSQKELADCADNRVYIVSKNERINEDIILQTQLIEGETYYRILSNKNREATRISPSVEDGYMAVLNRVRE